MSKKHTDLRTIFINASEISSVHESHEFDKIAILSMKNGDKFQIQANELMDVHNMINRASQGGPIPLVSLTLSELELK